MEESYAQAPNSPKPQTQNMRVDPQKLKDAFAKMKEIDENPEGEEARNYYK